MATRRSQYLAIFLTVFIDILGFGIVIPVLPLYAEHFGASELEIGLLVGIFSLAQFGFAPLWGKLSDRVGRKPVLLIGLAGTAAGYMVMGLAGSVAALFVGRLVSGIAGANLGAAQAYLADISPPEGRARAMGLLGAAFGLGFVFGPALGGWAGGTFGFGAPMFVAAALAAGNALFVATRVPESRQPGAASQGAIFPGLLANVRTAPYLWTLAAYFSVTVAFSMMTTLFALYLKHRFGLGLVQTGGILAGMGLLGAIVQGGLIGRLAKRFGEGSLAFAGAMLLACGLAVMAAAGSLWAMLLGTAGVGIGNSLLMPALSSLASRAAHPDWQGRALGVLQSCGSLARFLGPLGCGALLAFEHAGCAYAVAPLTAAFGVALLACGIVAMLGRAARD